MVQEIAREMRMNGLKYSAKIHDTEELNELMTDIRKSNKAYGTYPLQCFIEASLPAQPLPADKMAKNPLGKTWFEHGLTIHLNFQQLSGGSPGIVSEVVQRFDEKWRIRPLEGAFPI